MQGFIYIVLLHENHVNLQCTVLNVDHESYIHFSCCITCILYCLVLIMLNISVWHYFQQHFSYHNRPYIIRICAFKYLHLFLTPKVFVNQLVCVYNSHQLFVEVRFIIGENYGIYYVIHRKSLLLRHGVYAVHIYMGLVRTGLRPI